MLGLLLSRGSKCSGQLVHYGYQHTRSASRQGNHEGSRERARWRQGGTAVGAGSEGEEGVNLARKEDLRRISRTGG